MIGMAWELDADRPIYAQLVERIHTGNRLIQNIQAGIPAHDKNQLYLLLRTFG